MIDVIVAGAGPVGLATAIEARLAGLSVVVLDPRDGDIDKACGEGLMPGALPLLHRLGVDPAGMPLAGVSYRSGSLRADHRFRTGPGRGVRRTVLHAALAERAAELGVERVQGRIDSISQAPLAITAGGRDARWLIGADGLHSTVRRLAGLERPARGARRYGLRRHYALAPWSELIEVYWTPHAELYVTPVAADVVGIAVLGAPRTDLDAAIAAAPLLAERLAGAEVVSELRGAGPLRQRTAARTRGRILLVGDASGYVDAITGEGLRLGLEQARLAIAAIVDGAPRRYEREWRRSTRDFRVLTDGLVRAAGTPLRAGIVPLAARLPGLYGAIVERLAR